MFIVMLLYLLWQHTKSTFGDLLLLLCAKQGGTGKPFIFAFLVCFRN